MKKIVGLFAGMTVLSVCVAQGANSLTGSSKGYLDICVKASTDDAIFSQFRSLPDYKPILEVGQEGEHAAYVRANVMESTKQKMSQFALVDKIGNPVTYPFNDMGSFSGTTLRYIIVADQIKKMFVLPDDATIVEIGAGFGGQCYVLSVLQKFSKYLIYDLPEVNKLIKRFVTTLAVPGVQFMPLIQKVNGSIDLLISNYAYTECNEETKEEYFHKVIKHAKRGYMLCNAIVADFGSFIQLLKDHNMNPQVLDEPVFSYTGNKLVVWDTTAKK